MKFDFMKLRKWFMFGAVKAGGITVLIALFLSFVGTMVPRIIFASVPDINVRAQLESGVSSNIGTKLLSYVTAVIPFQTDSWFWNVVATLISVGVLFVAGAFLAGLLKKAFTPVKRVAIVALAGSIIPLLIQMGIGILTLTTAATTLLYFLIVGYIASKVFPKVLPIPEL